ncbi:MAG: FtsX-like permease family protein, partial [Anaerolineales bacterium]|nr:FtsX-like permease family protein [Anaerolineales bacterium]
ALTMSVPLYADAVYYRVLQEELTGGDVDEAGAAKRFYPPFAFMFRYIGAWTEPVEWSEVQQVDEYFTSRVANDLGLPQELFVRYFKTNNFQLFPQEDIAYADVRDPLAWVSFAFVSDLQNHITLLEGTLPAVTESSADSTVDVMISEPLAMELGLQVGETYVTFARRTTAEGRRTTQIPVHITGVWRAVDATETFWFYNPSAFEDVLFVPEETYLNRLSPYLEDEVYQALWYLVMDGDDVHADDAVPLLGRITAVQQRAGALLPDTRLDVSPVNALLKYWRSSRLLTVLLYAFSVPIIGLILAFIGLVVSLSVGRQRNEIAILRSRGATSIQITGIAILEGLLLGAIALAAGVFASMGIAQLIGKARSFLDFTLDSALRVSVSTQTLYFGLTAVGLALLAQVLPTVGASRHTIITYKQEQARSLRPPWWQRAWLDIILLIPAGYGAYLLRQQGAIVLPASGGSLVNDPFQNPLLFLVPALGIFALTLVIVRILPFFMSLIAWIAGRLNGLGVLMAARHLARTPGFYAAPLILLVLTLSLSTFTASLAQTLDHHLYDQVYYQVGAEMGVVESGESSETGSSLLASSSGSGGAAPATEEEDTGPSWYFLPVTEHLKVSGVEAAARVGRYTASTQLSGSRQTGIFYGIDRLDFPQVAFWRSDFAPTSLGALMNGLAAYSNGVLVPRSFMAQHALRGGDTFRLTVNALGQVNQLDVKIVGSFDMFPTWYPGLDGPLFVGNLEYLFEQAGGLSPYDVWLRTGEEADYDQIMKDTRDVGFYVVTWNAPRLIIRSEERRPERQGLFGLLSVGFIAAALLTVLGFLLYALFSFRRRYIEFGILRAVGLSSGQMTSYLAWELAFLIIIGVVAGTGLGVWVSNLFIPYLQIGTGPSAQIPPFVVEIAWPAIFRIYALFGALFLAALGGLAALLLRMRVFQAIKLGETV